MTSVHNHTVVTADETSIHVREVGSGPPLLLIPGLGFAGWSFIRQLGPLSKNCRVLAMDNRGSGQSDKPRGPYSIEQMADDAYAVLDQTAAAPAHLVGTSMGGYVALTLALRHPEAVRSLTLVATSCGGPDAHRVPQRTLDLWTNSAYLGAAGFARATMPVSFAPGWVDEHREEFESLLALRLQTPTPVEAWRTQFAACVAYFNEGAPSGAVAVPTTIVHGTADRVVPYENAPVLARRLPNASLVTMEGAGHLCWIERATEFNDILTATVTESDPIPR